MDTFGMILTKEPLTMEDIKDFRLKELRINQLFNPEQDSSLVLDRMPRSLVQQREFELDYNRSLIRE